MNDYVQEIGETKPLIIFYIIFPIIHSHFLGICFFLIFSHESCMFFSFLSSSSSAIFLHTFFLSSFYTSSFLRPFFPSFLRPFLLSFIHSFIHSFLPSFPLVCHSHYCEGLPDDVTEDMKKQLDANPNTIQYRLRTERSSNGGCTFGTFVLVRTFSPMKFFSFIFIVIFY